MTDVTFDDLIPQQPQKPQIDPEFASVANEPVKTDVSFDDLIPQQPQPQQVQRPAMAPQAPQQPATAPLAAAAPQQPVAQEQSSYTVRSGNSGTNAQRLSPADEHAYAAILKDGSFDEAVQFLNSRGAQTNTEELRGYFQQRDTTGDVSLALSYTAPPEVTREAPAQEMTQLERRGRGLLDAIPGGARLDAAVDAGVNWVQGDGYNYSEQLGENFQKSDQALEENPEDYYRGFAAGVLPQLLIGTGEARLLAAVPQLAKVPAVGRAGAMGAAHAGAYEVANTRHDLSTETGREAAAIDATKMAALGGVLGAGARKLGTATNDEVLEAGARQGIDLNPARTGGQGTQLAYQFVESFPGAVPLQRQTQRIAQGIETRVGEVADTVAGGAARPLEDVASDLKTGVFGSFGSTSAARGEKLYTSAYGAAGDTKIVPQTAIQTIDDEIARLSQNPTMNAGVIDELGKLRTDLSTGGGKTVEALRDIRTNLGRNVDGSVKNAMTRISKRLYGPLTNDISTGLTVAGKGGAAKRFAVADRLWQRRAETLDEIEGLLKLSPDQMASRLATMTRKGGNTDRLKEVLSTASVGERMDLQGAFLKQLGRPTAGQKTDLGDFSIESFLTNWNRMSDRSKALLFNGPIRSDIDDLTKIMGAERRYNRNKNVSKSGVYGVIGLAGLTEGYTALQGLGQDSGYDPMDGVVRLAQAAASTFGIAAVLAIPGMARLIARQRQGAKVTVEQVAKRLEFAAQRAPAQSATLLGLRDAVLGTGGGYEPMPIEGAPAEQLTAEELARQPLEPDVAAPEDAEVELAEGEFYYDENGEKVPFD
jgi:hypothetical protein